MSDARVSLIDRLAGLSFRVKLFVVSVVYMAAMFGLSEAGGGELAWRFWFASALPVGWLGALTVQWLSLRPRPALGAAIRSLADRARARPMTAALYVVAAIAIEAAVLADVLGLPLFPAG